MKKENTSKFIINQILLMSCVFIIASAFGYLFKHAGFPDTNTVVVYLLAVLIVAWLTKSFVFGLIASILATFLFNYFFAEPYYTFSVDDTNYTITFAIMTATALITSTLTSHAKRSEQTALDKEAETKAIYNLTNHLTDAKNIHDIASTATRAISHCFSCNAACLCFDKNNIPEPIFIQQSSDENQIRRETGNIQEIKHRMENLRTGYDENEEFYDWPVYGSEIILGVIRIPKEIAKLMSEMQMRLLRSMIESTALAMDRFHSVEQRIISREESIKERYRANLLRSISHDLRTPLSAIIGTSEMLMDLTEQNDPKYSLAENIHKDAEWLHSLVENILNLTRLQDGSLILKKQLEAVEEVVSSAVGKIAKRSPQHEISVHIPKRLLFVSMDARLIEQVLINLLDNAIRYTKPKDEIEIFIKSNKQKNTLIFNIRDRGTGIASTDLPNIFQMFYTSKTNHADMEHGIGLGLAICETIIKAHDGKIEAHNRAGGGAEFIFTLPMEKNENE